MKDNILNGASGPNAAGTATAAYETEPDHTHAESPNTPSKVRDVTPTFVRTGEDGLTTVPARKLVATVHFRHEAANASVVGQAKDSATEKRPTLCSAHMPIAVTGTGADGASAARTTTNIFKSECGA